MTKWPLAFVKIYILRPDIEKNDLLQKESLNETSSHGWTLMGRLAILGHFRNCCNQALRLRGFWRFRRFMSALRLCDSVGAQMIN